MQELQQRAPGMEAAVVQGSVGKIPQLPCINTGRVVYIDHEMPAVVPLTRFPEPGPEGSPRSRFQRRNEFLPG